MTVSAARWTRVRIFMVLAVFLAAFGLVMWRAFELQVLKKEKLARLADSECYKTVQLNPVRGEILDRHGEKLAVSLETESVFADPTRVKDPKAVAGALAKVLALDARDLAKKLDGKETFLWVKRQVSPKEAAAVRGLGLEGVEFLKESKRFYPNKTLAAHVLGFVGIDGDGLEGLELGHDQYLKGEPERIRVRRDALGRTFLDRVVEKPPETRGCSVTLTLDRRLQYLTEKTLAKGVEESGAKRGLALIVRPQTGEILALAVYPAFNPNAFSDFPASQRRNRVVTDTFEPGSTFKVFVVAGALEEKAVAPLEKFDCEKGALAVGKHVIHDHREYGWLTVDKVIKYSSNIGAIKIGEKLGPALVYEYLKRFSFGERTGVDFPGETAGLLRPYKKWYKVDAANVAFGQGVGVSALQMAMAMSALANDGLLMRPYLVDKITDGKGRVIKKARPQIARQVVSPQTAREVRAMLREVVTEGGTGVLAEPPGYPSAGKTGTAQKLDRAARRYSDRKYFSSFLGFVPYENPELTILVALDEPWPKIYGGQVAAPLFREIAEQALPLLNVPPVPTPTPETLTAAAKTETKTPPAARTPAISKPEDPEEPAEPVGQAEGALETRPGVMPDLAGLSMRRVLDLMSRYEVDLTFHGSGRAVWQAPAPGQPVQDGMSCQVRFEQ
ncbi:MAG: penicillin-binding protein [Thermodesulfobacteriota bacterium]